MTSGVDGTQEHKGMMFSTAYTIQQNHTQLPASENTKLFACMYKSEVKNPRG